MIPLTDAELTTLAAEVDAQLESLQSAALTSSPLLKTGADPSGSLPAASAQQAVIERATGENFEAFWQKFLRQARRDLCLPGGKLHEQWQKWGDLDSKAVVGHARSVLLGMGIGAQSVVGPVAVAAAVILLYWLLNLGIKAICEGCE